MDISGLKKRCIKTIQSDMKKLLMLRSSSIFSLGCHQSETVITTIFTF